MQGLAGVTQPLVKALVILNTDGKRLCSRFCDKSLWPTLESERTFETSLVRKLQGMGDLSDEVDLMEFSDFVVAYKQNDNVLLFVVADREENELVMTEVCTTLDEILHQVLGVGGIYEENVLQNLQWLLLIVDELVDQEGVIMEINAADLVERIGHGQSTFGGDLGIGEQTLSQALQTARDQITRSILS